MSPLARLTAAFALILTCALLAGPAGAAIPDSPKVDPGLRSWLAANPAAEEVKVWVWFRDKGVADGNLAQALEARKGELGERTLWRRAKVRQDALVDERDLPIHAAYRSTVLALGPVHRADSRVLNAISVRARVADLDRLAALDFVTRLSRVVAFQRREPLTVPAPPPAAPLGPGGSRLNYGSSFAQLNQITVPAVHDMGFSGAGVIVCMLDTGFYKVHEAFAAATILGEWDFINDDGNTQNETGDPYGQHDHGTYTWSTLGGRKEGTLYGPAYGASFLLAKTEDTSQEVPIEEDWWTEGIEWAEAHGADVVSSSLGYTDWYDFSDMDGQTAVTTIAANWATAQGVVEVNAMGNEGQYAGAIIAPADSAGVISCGAVDSSGSLAYFSSSGPTYDGRIKPDVCARGVSTYCASSSGSTSYTYVDGTSLSTPLIGGVAALLVQAHPTWTPADVQLALRQTASQSATPNNNYGWGIANTQAAVLSAGFGHVAGTVRNSLAQPLAAWVEVLESGVGTDTSPADGSYTLVVDPDVNRTVRATCFGYVTQQQVVNVPADTTETLNFVLAAAATGTVQGTVRDTAASPLAGVKVEAVGTPAAPVYTNGAGFYTITLPGGASYDLRFSLASYGTTTLADVPVTQGGTTTRDVTLPDWPSILIWEPDPTPLSGAAMQSALASLGWDSVLTDDLLAYGSDLSGYQAIFVLVGIYSNNYVFGSSSAEETALVAYLQGGGNLYLEGGDIWCYDSYPTTLRPYFHYLNEGDGSADLSTVNGVAATFTAGMSFSYTGENSWIDQLGAGTGAYEIFVNPSDAYGCGVAYDAGSYRTLALSYEFGGLVDGASTQAALMQEYLDFFGLELPQPDTVGVALACTPPSGTLPFTVHFSATLSNLYAGFTRILAGRIEATLASGQTFSNWRSGYTNVGPSGSFNTQFNVNFPALGALVGNNVFRLLGQDVTASPFNQPPYPASGDTDSDTATVTGIAP